MGQLLVNGQLVYGGNSSYDDFFNRFICTSGQILWKKCLEYTECDWKAGYEG